MLDFRPPKDSLALIKVIKLGLPLYMKFKLHDTYVEPVPGALERFAASSGKRGMVCPNHANRHDPQVMFAFSRLAKEDFNFVAAREVFDWDNGRNGWWLQHLGAFSVVRGAADRESFKTSRKIICEGKKKLVLFPEGEISRQNDTLMPLESGAVQLCFWAVEELAKGDTAGGRPVAPVLLIPVAIKYTYSTDIKPALGKTLALLEAKLAMKTSQDRSLFQRLRSIGEALLTALEAQYDCKVASNQSVNERISSMRRQILKNAANQLRIALPENGKQLDWVRIIRNSLDDFIYSDDPPRSDYERKMHDEKAAFIRTFYRDLDRVVNFISIHEGYLAENRTQERFVDILERLESEILGGEPTLKGPRRVLIDVGTAIDMSSQYNEYRRAKRSVLTRITDELATQISTMLLKLENMRSPIMVN